MSQESNQTENYQQDEKNFLLAEEILIVRHSGEIPEVAYHGSLYYLTDDEEGPQLSLSDEDRRQLKEQVVARYKEIMLRDLTPENRDKSLYRGLARCIVNWHRLCQFCEREQHSMNGVREEIAEALLHFLHHEARDVAGGKRKSSINCTQDELCAFLDEMGLDTDALPAGWQGVCKCRI